MKLQEYVNKLLAELRFAKTEEEKMNIHQMVAGILKHLYNEPVLKEKLVEAFKKENIEYSMFVDGKYKKVEPEDLTPYDLYMALAQNGKDYSYQALTTINDGIRKNRIENNEIESAQINVDRFISHKFLVENRDYDLDDVAAYLIYLQINNPNLIDEKKLNDFLDMAYGRYAYRDEDILKVDQELKKNNEALDQAKLKASNIELKETDTISFDKDVEQKFYQEFLDISNFKKEGEKRQQGIFDEELKAQESLKGFMTAVNSYNLDEMNGFLDNQMKNFNNTHRIDGLIDKYEQEAKNNNVNHPAKRDENLPLNYYNKANGLAKVSMMNSVYELIHTLKITPEEFIKDPMKALNAYEKQMSGAYNTDDSIEKNLEAILPPTKEELDTQNRIYFDTLNYLCTLDTKNEVNLKLVSTLEEKRTKLLANPALKGLDINQDKKDVDLYKNILLANKEDKLNTILEGKYYDTKENKVLESPKGIAKAKMQKFHDEVALAKKDPNYPINPDNILDIDKVIESYRSIEAAIKRKYGVMDLSNAKSENVKAARRELVNLYTAVLDVTKDIRIISEGNKALEDKFNNNALAATLATDFNLVRDSLPSRDIVSTLQDVKALDDVNVREGNAARISEKLVNQEKFAASNFDYQIDVLTQNIEEFQSLILNGDYNDKDVLDFTNAIKDMTNSLYEIQKAEIDRLTKEYESGEIPEAYFKECVSRIYDGLPIGDVKVFQNEEEMKEFGRAVALRDRGLLEVDELKDIKEFLNAIQKPKEEIKIDLTNYNTTLENLDKPIQTDTKVKSILAEVKALREKIALSPKDELGNKKLEAQINAKLSGLLLGYLGENVKDLDDKITDIMHPSLAQKIKDLANVAQKRELAYRINLKRGNEGLPYEKLNEYKIEVLKDKAKELGLNPDEIIENAKILPSQILDKDTLELVENEFTNNEKLKDLEIKYNPKMQSFEGMKIYLAKNELENVSKALKNRQVFLYHASKSKENMDAVNEFYTNLASMNENASRYQTKASATAMEIADLERMKDEESRNEAARDAYETYRQYRNVDNIGYEKSIKEYSKITLKDEALENIDKLNDTLDFDLNAYAKAKDDLTLALHDLNTSYGKARLNKVEDTVLIEKIKRINSLNNQINKMDKSIKEFTKLCGNISPNSRFMPQSPKMLPRSQYIPKEFLGNAKAFAYYTSMKAMQRIAKEYGYSMKELFGKGGESKLNELAGKINQRMIDESVPNEKSSLSDITKKLFMNKQEAYKESPAYQDKKALMSFIQAMDENNRTSNLRAEQMLEHDLVNKTDSILKYTNLLENESINTYYNLMVSGEEDKTKLIQISNSAPIPLAQNFVKRDQVLDLIKNKELYPADIEERFNEMKAALNEVGKKDLKNASLELDQLGKAYLRALNDYFTLNPNELNEKANKVYKEQLKNPQKFIKNIHNEIGKPGENILAEIKADLKKKPEADTIAKTRTKEIKEFLENVPKELVKAQEEFNKSQKTEEDLKKFQDTILNQKRELNDACYDGVIPEYFYKRTFMDLERFNPNSKIEKFGFKLDKDSLEDIQKMAQFKAHGRNIEYTLIDPEDNILKNSKQKITINLNQNKNNPKPEEEKAKEAEEPNRNMVHEQNERKNIQIDLGEGKAEKVGQKVQINLDKNLNKEKNLEK